MSTIIKTDELTQFHEYGIYTPSRIIELSGEIDEDNANEFIRNIRILDHINDEDIKVLINTVGGDVHSGLAIYDAMRECQSKVITHVVGAGWSMGAIIFQAGDERMMSSNATLMVHIGQDAYDTDHRVNIKRWIKENEEVGEIADGILYDRIKQKKPHYKKSQFEKLIMFDTIYRVDDAIDMGLADTEVTHRSF